MITLMAGTNRPGSYTRRVTAVLERVYRGLRVPLHVIDLAELPPAVFEPAAYETRPASFEPTAQAVLKSAGLVVVCPEYNGSMPGVLKYFIDLLDFPESFEHRPVCFVGLSAGQFGGLRPIEHLQQIFGYRNAYVYPHRVFLPGINRLMDENGDFRDVELLGRLQKQAEGFIGFVSKLTGNTLAR